MNETTQVWQEKLQHCLVGFDHVASPRGMEVREVINGRYVVPMPAYLNLKSRNVNLPFMFAEAAWIISGSNHLAELTPYMKGYAKFSDDQVFMRGAYGPKVVDQLGYVSDCIMNDFDTRQAVLTIWRERPGLSKDIPCTVAMQFLVRDRKLHVVVTMRSQDVVLGYTYDVFTFSMVAKALQCLLHERGLGVELGNLHVNAGSLHLYDNYYAEAANWLEQSEVDTDIDDVVGLTLRDINKYYDLVSVLKSSAKALAIK